MRFYTKTHDTYCGIDLHARTLYVCILNRDGEILLHRKMAANPETFLRGIAPYRTDIWSGKEMLSPSPPPLRTARTRHRVRGSSNRRTPRGALLL